MFNAGESSSKCGPFQFDVPGLIDMDVFKGERGCFYAHINAEDKLIVEIHRNFRAKRQSICEYSEYV